MFDWIESHADLGKVDVCVPNAGLDHPTSLLDGAVRKSRIEMKEKEK